MTRSVKTRKGMPSAQLSKEEFVKRFRSRFYDPAFEPFTNEIEKIIEKAWDGYHQYRKSPRTTRAGRGFADPEFELPLEWSETQKVENLRRMITDWLSDKEPIPAGNSALVGSYIGYYEPYATSHDELDKEKGFQEQVQNAARSLVQAVRLLRRGQLKLPDASISDPRQK